MKQIIVMRNDLNMRKGKMIVQGAHAAMMFLIPTRAKYTPPREKSKEKFNSLERQGRCIEEWVKTGMKKVCVQVNSEAELFALDEKAKSAGIISYIVTDAGHTEFHGQPTNTCLALGPDEDENLDKLTGELKLL